MSIVATGGVNNIKTAPISIVEPGGDIPFVRSSGANGTQDVGSGETLLAFDHRDGGETGGAGNGIKSIIDVLVSMGIIAGDVGERILGEIKNVWNGSENLTASNSDNPDIPRADPETGEVYVGEVNQGTFEAIFEPGPLATGDGGGDGPIDRPRRTSGSGDDEEDANWEDNSERGAQNQADWVARVLVSIGSGVMTVRDIRILVSVIDELGDKIDPANKIAIFTEAVKALAGAGEVNEGAPDIEVAAEQIVEAYGFDQILQPYVEIALVEEVKMEREKPESNVDFVQLVAELVTGAGRKFRFMSRVQDAIAEPGSVGSKNYDAWFVFNNLNAFNEIYQLSVINHLRPDGKLHVPGKAVDPFLDPTDIMYFKAAVAKRDRAGQIEVDENGEIKPDIVRAILVDADNLRSERLPDPEAARLKEAFLQAFPEFGQNAIVVPPGEVDVSPSVRRAFSSHIAPANSENIKYVGSSENMMIPEFGVLATVISPTGERFFVRFNVEANQFLNTVKTSDGEMHTSWIKDGWEIELDEIPGLLSRQIWSVVPTAEAPLPGWERRP